MNYAWELPTDWELWCRNHNLTDEEIIQCRDQFGNTSFPDKDQKDSWDTFTVFVKRKMPHRFSKGSYNPQKLSQSSSLILRCQRYFNQEEISRKTAYPVGMLLEQEIDDPLVKIWNQAQEDLRNDLTELIYRAWILKIRFRGINGRTVKLGAPNRFIAEAVEHRCKESILQALMKYSPTKIDRVEITC